MRPSQKQRLEMLCRYCCNFSESLIPNFSFLQNRKLMPKFVLKEMEVLYIEEMNAAINKLKSNLVSVA